MKNSPLISFWKHHPIADQSGELLAKSTLHFEQSIDNDFIKITPAGTWLAVAHGAIDENWENDSVGRRRIVNTKIKNIGDWLTLSNFETSEPELLKEMIKACELVISNTNKPVLTTIFCPISVAIQISGLDTFKEHINTAPEIVLKGIETIIKNTIYAIDKFKNTGIQGMYFVTQHMNNSMLSQGVYAKFGSVANQKCIDSFNDLAINIFHIHGENLYFEIKNLNESVIFHYEKSSLNPDYQTLLSNYSNNKFAESISINEILKTDLNEEITNKLNLLNANIKHSNLFLGGCVLPLQYDAEILNKWIKIAKAIL